MHEETIGKVTATERQPSTTTRVHFWVSDDVIVAPFDIVRIPHVKKAGHVTFSYAVVQELEYITDSTGHLSSYISSDFGDVAAEPFNQRIGTTIATAEIVYNTDDVEMPIRNGAPVQWADYDGIRRALGMEDYARKIPAGYIVTSNGMEVPVEFNADYLLGPEGAHFNVTGISGLATKTSYAMFVLSAIQQRLRDNVSMIVFNVKGRDLLSLDKDGFLPEEQRRDWERCGLEPKPFQDVTYLYPFSPREETYYTSSRPIPDIIEDQIRAGCAFNYRFDAEHDRDKLIYLLSDIDDPGSTMDSIAFEIAAWDDIRTWPGLRDRVHHNSVRGQSENKSISVMSWRKFNRLITNRTSNGVFADYYAVSGTRQAHIEDVVLKLRPGQVLVIDIEPLPDYLQRFVFGHVVQTIYDAKLGDVETPVDLGKVVIFADELNKYAPRSVGSPVALTQNVLEVTERGRSLGVVLFGAQQFRSGVHDGVLGNCSTNVYGRTSPVEIAKCPDYRYFPSAYQSAVTRIPQGTLLLQHAVYKTALIKVRFPYPAYFQPK